MWRSGANCCESKKRWARELVMRVRMFYRCRRLVPEVGLLRVQAPSTQTKTLDPGFRRDDGF